MQQALPLLLVAALLAACTASPGPGAALVLTPDRDGTSSLSSAAPAAVHEVDLSAFFPNIERGDATFVVLDAATERLMAFNVARAGLGIIPASTFKIANAAIALETGVATGPDFMIPWDGRRTQEFWPTAWSRDHTLESALRSSAVWYYQELARRIGAERMLAHLERFDYGNRTIGGGIDQFWLTGELRISPIEQLHFLRRLRDGELSLSATTHAALERMLLLEETTGYRLSGKTGTVNLTSTRELAWLVGWVERDGATWFYALNVEGEPVWEQWGPPAARIALVRDLLRALEILPES